MSQLAIIEVSFVVREVLLNDSATYNALVFLVHAQTRRI